MLAEGRGLIERNERILYAQLLQKILKGDKDQLKLASLLGYRLMKRAISIENILDLHFDTLHDYLSSRVRVSEVRKTIHNTNQLLRATLSSYSESYSDAISTVKNKSRELEARTKHLETEVMERTEELESSRKELEEKVEEISRDQGTMIAMIEDLNRINRELVATREKLKSSEKLAILGQLSLGLSHELRNPLGVIENSASLIENAFGKQNRDVEKWTKLIKNQTRLMNRVIESVLCFSMNDFKSNDLFQMNSVVENAIKRCHAAGAVEVRTIGTGPAWIRGDEEQITQAVSHMVRNGIESAGRDGKVSVDLNFEKFHNGSAPGKMEISIRDTGAGLSKDLLPLIFEPFFTTKEGKLGLGLCLSNAIVRKHGGCIGVHSAEGETCFTITLPVGEESAHGKY